MLYFIGFCSKQTKKGLFSFYRYCRGRIEKIKLFNLFFFWINMFIEEIIVDVNYTLIVESVFSI